LTCDFAGVLRFALPELLVAEGPPEVPAGYGSKWTPSLPKLLDVAALAIDVPDGSFQSYIAQWEHVWVAKNHYPEC
jgi:hypothetical protein